MNDLERIYSYEYMNGLEKFNKIFLSNDIFRCLLTDK